MRQLLRRSRHRPSAGNVLIVVCVRVSTGLVSHTHAWGSPLTNLANLTAHAAFLSQVETERASIIVSSARERKGARPASSGREDGSSMPRIALIFAKAALRLGSVPAGGWACELLGIRFLSCEHVCYSDACGKQGSRGLDGRFWRSPHIQ